MPEFRNRVFSPNSWTIAKREIALVQQRTQAVEVPVVNEKGVSSDKVLDIAFATVGSHNLPHYREHPRRRVPPFI